MPRRAGPGRQLNKSLKQGGVGVGVKTRRVQRTSGKIIKSIACPACVEVGRDSTGDHLKVYEQEDGSVDSHCHACGANYGKRLTEEIESGGIVSTVVRSAVNDTEMIMTPVPTGVRKPLTITDILQMKTLAVDERRLDKSSMVFYGVKSGTAKGKEVLRFYPRTTNGKITGYKCRKLPKEFNPAKGARPVGETKTDEFFGQHLFNPSRVLIITAGEEDAIAAWQATKMFGKKGSGYASVSAPDGSKSLEKTILSQMAWVAQFERVIFAVDQEDDKDLAYANECCQLLAPGQGHIAKFSENDPCDMLKAGKGKELYNAIWDAEKWTPEGVVLSGTTWDTWINRDNYESVPLPVFMGLNDILRGLRIGGLYTIGAGTGVGKTTLLKHLQYHLWDTTEDGIGVIALEEPLCDSIGLLMSLHLRARLQIDNTISEANQKKAWGELFQDNRFSFEQGFGAMTDEDLFTKIRFMVRAQNCRYIFLDHLTLLADMFGDGSGSKIEQTARLVAKIKNLTQELNCAIIMVSHVRKTGEGVKSYEDGGVPNLDALYGSAQIKQYSDAVLVLSRKPHDGDYKVYIHVLKNRLTGRLGKSNPMVYNQQTGWLEKLEEQLEDEDGTEI
jgi:twinkle protein